MPNAPLPRRLSLLRERHSLCERFLFGEPVLSRQVPSRRAVTFTEILIAVVMFAIILVPAINMLFNFRVYTLHTEDVSLALALANEKVEQYKHVEFKKLLDLEGNRENGEVTSQKDALNNAYDPIIYKKFKRKVQLKASDDKNRVTITVHVWWYEGTYSINDKRIIKITALKTNEDLF
jgi:hypothetical protein